MFANVVCDASGKWKGLLYLNLNLLRTLSSSAETTRQEIVKCCRILRVAEDSTLDDIRAAFITLAKKYHPDSDSPEANAEKFQEVESAYRILQAKYLADQRHEMASNSNTKSFDAVQEYDIQHTAPQHRQYLSFDGYGSGTPSQRQKQYQKQRAVTAVDNVMSHRIHNLNLNCSHNREEALAVKDKTEAKKIKTRYGMERLVEDLIQESIAKGDFDNLSGKGKPLKQGVANPYVDFTTHKLNEVLIDNGFTPEWILLQKEIREERDHVRQCLIAKRKTLGLLPLSGQDEHIWKVAVKNCEPLVQQINKKINKYNLVVPILQKQMLQVQLDKEADKILQEIKGESLDTPDLKNNFEKSAGNSLFNLFHEIFGK